MTNSACGIFPSVMVCTYISSPAGPIPFICFTLLAMNCSATRCLISVLNTGSDCLISPRLTIRSTGYLCAALSRYLTRIRVNGLAICSAVSGIFHCQSPDRGALVTGVEGSRGLVDRAQGNAQLNELEERCRFHVEDLFKIDSEQWARLGQFDKLLD